MPTVVFASCMSASHDDKQPVWKDAIGHKPQWLILGGDNMYMDYGFDLDKPRGWSLKKFTQRMHEQYAAQLAVPSFRALVSSIPAGQVIGVCDDHDFAWNNCYGTDPTDGMPEKRVVARRFFHHYFETLNTRPLPEVLPTLPAAPGPVRELHRMLDIGSVRVLLCDVRSHREDRPRDRASAQLLGEEQERWLLEEIATATGPIMVVSGSVMLASGDQSWDCFSSFYQRFLDATKGRRVLFVGGDIHRNRLASPAADLPVEIVSSSAALGFPFKDLRHFGVIDLDEVEARIFLYRRGKVQYSGVAPHDPTKKVRLSVRDVPERMTRRRAVAQKAAAARSLSAARGPAIGR